MELCCARHATLGLTAVIVVYSASSELRTETKIILLHLCAVYGLALILFLATATTGFEGVHLDPFVNPIGPSR